MAIVKNEMTIASQCKTKKIWIKLLATLLVLSCLNAEGAYAQDSVSVKKKIMVLYGNWEVTRWQKQFSSNFYDEMINDPDLNVSITNEHLEIDYIPDNADPQIVKSHLLNKNIVNPIDLVISVLPKANRFLLSYGKSLFPGIPKVFLIPGSRNMEKTQGFPEGFVIPSSSTIALKNNIDRIFSIIPKTKHLFIVSGIGMIDLYYQSVAKKVISSSDQAIKATYLEGLPIDDLLEYVSKLPEHSAILFLTFAEDTNKKKYISIDFFPQISIQANAPVFVFFDTLFGKGVVGGNLTSAKYYAKKAAEISTRLILGEEPSSLLPIKGVTKDVYDWRQLKRWNISEDHLPHGSLVRFKTETFWEKYTIEIIFILSVLFLQTLMIIMLINTLKRRRLADKARTESEKQYRSLYNTMNEGVCQHELVYDQSGNAIDYRILNINPQYEKILHINRSDVIGKLATEVYQTDEAPYLETFVEVAKTSKPFQFESYFSPMEKHFSVSVFSPEKGKFATIFTDITKRKQTEEELEKHREHLEDLVEERTKDLQMANSELSQFTYVVSHDLKAPLRAIHNYADFLHEDLKDTLDGDQKIYLSGLTNAVTEADTLVSDLLELSRVGHTDVLLQSINVGTILSDLIESLVISEKVTVKMESNWPEITVQLTLFRQILQNLISNAAKFNHNKQKTIQLGWSEVDEVFYEFFVRDNGIGIESRFHERIFKAFDRLHTKDEYEGTGIGLAIVKKAVLHLQGTLRLESQPNKGSTFYFTIPKIQKGDS
jgi:signal transduction histidine kinase